MQFFPEFLDFTPKNTIIHSYPTKVYKTDVLFVVWDRVPIGDIERFLRKKGHQIFGQFFILGINFELAKTSAQFEGDVAGPSKTKGEIGSP